MIIGITGGTGCGKTTLLNAVRDLGGTVYDCDEIYHALLSSGAAMGSAIASRFPEAMEGDILNRKKLGRIVFSDAAALADLNQITHAAVREELLRRLDAAQPQLAAIDAIGLFEGGLAPLCDVTVAVTAPRKARIRRLMARDGISAEYAGLRLEAQHDDGWFRERCDFCLENDGDLEAFTKKCIAFLKKLGIIGTV